MGKDYYKILGVDKNASPDKIKKAYRKLSKQHHPDVADNKDSDDAVFKDISEAYSVLSDETKKSNYDRGGQSTNPFRSGQRKPGGFGFEDLFGGMGGFNFDDIFGKSGGGGPGRRNVHRPGSDIKATIDLTLDEVEVGSSRKIKYKRKENCTSCNGKGGKDEKPCMSCNGSGSTVNTTRTPMGIVQQQIICNNCSGTGKIIISKCNVCHGSKHKEIDEELTIDIPIGVSEEVLYKYTGKGHSNQYGVGDLLVHFRVKPHRYFKKQVNNLIYSIELPFSVLVAGGLVKIKGLNNVIHEVDIPSMTKPGFMLRLKGKGLPNPENMSDRGDIILSINVEFPSEVNEEELELISKLNNKPNFIYKQK
tara:strand:+ start:1982 stop:3070 length:1089 start_codon:yes stop_codon:yes gene_type:complete